MENIDGLYANVSTRFNPEMHLSDAGLTPSEKHLIFAMRSNGFFRTKDSSWLFNHGAAVSLESEFLSLKTSFFGPGGSDHGFFSTFDDNNEADPQPLLSAFSQDAVIKVIDKYRGTNEDVASKIAFILGGLVRYNSSKFSEPPRDDWVKFTAQMTNFAQDYSSLAVASSMAMYIISGGSIEPSNRFKRDVFFMAEAVEQDPVDPLVTADLGLSQTLRLKSFIDRLNHQPADKFPDIKLLKEPFHNFPTVGAEFHFPVNAPEENNYFWERLALLNMSQYQEGSQIQLSRDDRGVIEVRMNPSIYPVTIANWRRMMYLLPELKRTYFTTTLNRSAKTDDFNWCVESDNNLVKKLKSIGLLCYAGLYEDIPEKRKIEEIQFGTVYLGQTVRMVDGIFSLTGNWGKNYYPAGSGEYGQLGIYAGFGELFPYLTYYSSMVLANPDVLKDFNKNFWEQIKYLRDALSLSPEDRRDIFSGIQENIQKFKRLHTAHVAGQEIMTQLNS